MSTITHAQPREAAFVPAHDSHDGVRGAGLGEESEASSATKLRRLRGG